MSSIPNPVARLKARRDRAVRIAKAQIAIYNDMYMDSAVTYEKLAPVKAVMQQRCRKAVELIEAYDAASQKSTAKVKRSKKVA